MPIHAILDEEGKVKDCLMLPTEKTGTKFVRDDGLWVEVNTGANPSIIDCGSASNVQTEIIDCGSA